MHTKFFKGIRAAMDDFVSLIYPDQCAGCDKSLLTGEEWLCTHCIYHLPRTNYYFGKTNKLTDKLYGRLPVAGATAFLNFRKTGIAQKLIHNLKYNQQPEIGLVLGRLLGKQIKETSEASWDLIVPVPLHKSRLRQRGYNQSEKFAEGLGEILNVPLEREISLRKIKTRTQTKKDKIGRWKNVEQVFSVSSPDKLNGKRVLLVDDVITTGATIEACGNSLISAGCKSLHVACIAAAV